VAVLARLDGESHDLAFKGRWHVEAGFGPCQAIGTLLFDTLADAALWADERVRTGSGPRVAPSDARSADDTLTT
jgi:hypothetical protein